MPYVYLAKCIFDNWKFLKYICSNSNSIIVPESHPDGRIIIMDYEKLHEISERDLSLAFTKKFIVHSDITNFFPSIYTHAIPWATVGFLTAKANKSNKNVWYNQLDYYQRLTKRNETQGVPMGPATSNIVSELILAIVDNELSKTYTYFRHIDDYKCFCDTFEEGEEFIRRLSKLLSKYKLTLNISMTFPLKTSPL